MPGKPIESEGVRLSGNKQILLTQEVFKNCESFDSSYCNLSDIPLTILNPLNLCNLSLDFNRISDLAAIKPLKNLRVLLLSNNLLKDLNALVEIVKELPYLSILDVTDNLFISPDADRAQVEVSEIVMSTCILLACKKLKILNRVVVSSLERKRASRRMAHLKGIARDYARTSENGLLEDWKPELLPLEDMTAGEELVLEVL
jgi:Leucine-rich repeat (LRR) protein